MPPVMIPHAKDNAVSLVRWAGGGGGRVYLSVFQDGKIHTTTRYPENGPQPGGTVMTIAFELQREQFVALNGGPKFPSNPGGPQRMRRNGRLSNRKLNRKCAAPVPRFWIPGFAN